LSLEFVGEKKSIVTFLESRLAEIFEILVVTRNLDWDLVPGWFVDERELWSFLGSGASDACLKGSCTRSEPVLFWN
jgi:hypothetical protein